MHQSPFALYHAEPSLLVSLSHFDDPRIDIRWILEDQDNGKILKPTRCGCHFSLEEAPLIINSIQRILKKSITLPKDPKKFQITKKSHFRKGNNGKYGTHGNAEKASRTGAPSLSDTWKSWGAGNGNERKRKVTFDKSRPRTSAKIIEETDSDDSRQESPSASAEPPKQEAGLTKLPANRSAKIDND